MGFDECTGEEYEWDAFRWGPDDSLDADDLEREIEERLGGYVEGKVEVMAQEVGVGHLADAAGRVAPVTERPVRSDGAPIEIVQAGVFGREHVERVIRRVAQHRCACSGSRRCACDGRSP